MSDQTEVKQEYPSQIFVSVSGNHPMAEAAVASVLSTLFNDIGVAGRRQGENVIDSKYASEVVNGLSNNGNNTINVMANPLTLEAMRGSTQAWDYPAWNDESQPWTALVSDSLRNLWPTFTTHQKRAIYDSFNALNIEVDEEPLSLEHALSIVNPNNTEAYIEFRPNAARDGWSEIVVDGTVDLATLDAITFIARHAVPGTDGSDTPVLSSAPAPVEGGDIPEAPTLEMGENPATNTAHAAAELPDGREVPELPTEIKTAAGPEHNPEDVQLDVGQVPTINADDPVLAPVVPQQDPTAGLASVSFDETNRSTLNTPVTSGSVAPYHGSNSLED